MAAIQPATSFQDIWWHVTVFSCIACAMGYFLASLLSFRGWTFRGVSSLLLPFGFAAIGFVISFCSVSLLSVGVAGMYTSQSASLDDGDLAIIVILISAVHLFFAVGNESSMKIL